MRPANRGNVARDRSNKTESRPTMGRAREHAQGMLGLLIRRPAKRRTPVSVAVSIATVSSSFATYSRPTSVAAPRREDSREHRFADLESKRQRAR
jgi:hypothetical protein